MQYHSQIVYHEDDSRLIIVREESLVLNEVVEESVGGDPENIYIVADTTKRDFALVEQTAPRKLTE